VIVSVIIPCRNEEKNIAACVNAVFASQLPPGFEPEVFIVDGESDDGTLQIVHELQKKYPKLQVLLNSQRITPVAFNLGIKAAHGDFIQIVGARQIMANDYIRKGIEHLQQHPETWCVGGKVENVYENELGEIIAKAMDTPFGVGAGNFRILKESSYVDTVGTPLFNKAVFEKIGLFDEALVRNQDDELSYRIVKAGGKIFMDVDMKVKYYVRGSFKNLFRQYYQYGYWKVYVNRKHRTITTLRQLAPAALMLFIIVFLPLGIFSFIKLFQLHQASIGIIWPILFYCGVIIPYIFVAALFAFSKSEKITQVTDYFRTFLILHSSYGLGYLEGILQFLILRKKSAQKNTLLSR
jgi:glycosyltransferase involved in cell wall biosynthesis